MITDDLALAAVDLAVARDDRDALGRIAAQLDAEDDARHARLEAPGALAAAAAWYAAHGIPVFPLAPRGKRPATRSGFKDATTDPATVASWWAATPQANIGMPTGVIADVIDVDGPVGAVNFAPYYEEVMRRAVGVVSTPRPGGMHYYVPPDPRAKNTASRIAPHVDTRGRGGYVVLPPSVTDDHGPGRRYVWLRPLAVSGPRSGEGTPR